MYFFRLLKKSVVAKDLHLTDHATLFLAATFAKSKHRQETISYIFTIFEQNVFSDYDSDFRKEEYDEMCESLDITGKNTKAQSPFSNGLCDNHNIVLDDAIQGIP